MKSLFLWEKIELVIFYHDFLIIMNFWTGVGDLIWIFIPLLYYCFVMLRLPYLGYAFYTFHYCVLHFICFWEFSIMFDSSDRCLWTDVGGQCGLFRITCGRLVLTWLIIDLGSMCEFGYFQAISHSETSLIRSVLQFRV